MSNTPDQLWLMLGEIRADLKHLLSAHSDVNRRLDDIENGAEMKLTEHDTRIKKLESFSIRIGVLTGALGVFVPTAITVAAKYLGLL